jgi:hypothetical protein
VANASGASPLLFYLNLEDSQRNNLNTKTRKVDNKPVLGPFRQGMRDEIKAAPASREYPSVWGGVEIWSKLDRLPRETEILRLELVIDESGITCSTTGCIKYIETAWDGVLAPCNSRVGFYPETHL